MRYPLKYSLRAIAVLVAGVFWTACASEPTTPQIDTAKLYHGRKFSLLDSAQAVDSASVFMTAGGCVPVHGHRVPGSVLVMAPPAAPLKFDCSTLSHDSTVRLLAGYQDHRASWTPGEHLAYLGHWEFFDYSGTVCHDEHVQVSNPAHGGEFGEDVVITTPDGYTKAYVPPGTALTSYYFGESVCEDYEAWGATFYGPTGDPQDPSNPFDWGSGGAPAGLPPEKPAKKLLGLTSSPTSADIALHGFSGQFTVTAAYDDGTTMQVWPTNWSYSPSGVAHEDDAGTFAADTSGTTVATGVFAGQSTTITLSVATDPDAPGTDETSECGTDDGDSYGVVLLPNFVPGASLRTLSLYPAWTSAEHGPFVPEEEFVPCTMVMQCSHDITPAQSDSVLAKAVESGEWSYTQGGIHGGTEPPKNLSQKVGDCTDFTWNAVRSALGSSWNHGVGTILRTATIENGTDDELKAAGYRRVSADSARAGDIIEQHGHAGVYVGNITPPGKAAGSTGWGWANNGRPSTTNAPRIDSPTGYFNFTTRPYPVTFLRPIVPCAS